MVHVVVQVLQLVQVVQVVVMVREEGKSCLGGLSWARVKLTRVNVAMVRSPTRV